MSALLMARDLERLMQRYDQTLTTPDLVPLAPPSDCPLVLEGYASTTDVVDVERIRIAPFAFGASPSKNLPLLYNHDAEQPAGSIDELYYDAKGQLMVRVTVTHARARRCQAFSIGARVREYALRDAYNPNFYAVVSRAELTDISLVDRPVNPNARVLHRSRPTAIYTFFDLMRQRVALCQRLVSIMQQESRP